MQEKLFAIGSSKQVSSFGLRFTTAMSMRMPLHQLESDEALQWSHVSPYDFPIEFKLHYLNANLGGGGNGQMDAQRRWMEKYHK